MPEQNTSAGSTIGKVASHAGVAGGTLLLMELLTGHQELVAKLAENWGGPAVILAGLIGSLLFIADRHMPTYIEAQREIAAAGASQALSMQGLSTAITASLSREDDVRAATRALSADIGRLSDKVDSLIGIQTHVETVSEKVDRLLKVSEEGRRAQ